MFIPQSLIPNLSLPSSTPQPPPKKYIWCQIKPAFCQFPIAKKMSSTRIIATGSTSTNHYFLIPSLTDTQLRNALNQRQGKRVNASPTPLPDLHVLKVFGKQRKKYTLPFKIVKLIIVQSDMWPPPV